MSEQCSGSCGSCSSDCDSRKPSREELLEPMNEYSKVKRVIGVVSGKGGVGKSFVTSYLSVLMKRRGYETAILDADVTGPSIPKAFHIHEKVTANEMGIFPALSKEGVKVMSINLLLDSEETPVVWRGPIIAGTVKQFWSEVVWGDVDYMFVDMPPGTGDVPLTVFQSIPLDGIIVVTSPQELVGMIVAKAVNMAESMEIPILGIIENYSYISCGNCGERISVFGESHADEAALKFGVPVLARLPIDPVIARAVDGETIENLEGAWLDNAADYLEENYSIKKVLEKPHSEEEKEASVRKIAVACDENNNIHGHFDAATTFKVFKTEGKRLIETSMLEVSQEAIETVNILRENQIDVLICGGVSSQALNALLQQGILVIPGQNGDIEVSAAAYMDGSLLNGK